MTPTPSTPTPPGNGNGYRPSADILKVMHLAAETEGLLSICLMLIVRGDRFAFPIKRALVNAAACMVDSHEVKEMKH